MGTNITAVSTVMATASSEATSGQTVMISADPNGKVRSQVSPSPESNVTNNTIRHRNPVRADSGNRPKDLQRVLEGRLANRLERSVIHINQSRYEQAQSVLGEEYLDQLEKYREVTGEGIRGTEGTAPETFSESRTRQLGYAQNVSEFRETLNSYQEARENGNDQRARELGRELLHRGDEVSRQSRRLNESYERLGNQTGVNLTSAQTQIREIQRSVNESQELVEETEFIETDLRIREADEQGSFTDPLVVTGTLASENGSVTNRQIRLDIGTQKYTVETDADGKFTVRYRPTGIPVSRSTVTVAYVPDNESRYLGSNVSIPVALTEVSGHATIEMATVEAAYGDPVTVSGVVTSSGEPVSNLSLAVVINGKQLGTAHTVANGSFTFKGRLPAEFNSGNQTLTVQNVMTDSAVVVEPATSPIQIQQTTTSLSATATRDAERVTVSGRLTAADRPVPGRQVVVSADDERLGTARTTENGSYVVRVATDELGQVATITFNGTGTNLRSAETRVRISPRALNQSSGSSDATPETPDEGAVNRLLDILTGTNDLATGSSFLIALLTSPIGLVAGGLAIGATGLALVALSDWRGGPGDALTTMSSAGSVVDSGGNTTSSEFTALLTRAKAELDAGNTDEAIIGAYGAARSALLENQAEARGRTHWQFFEACVAEGADADALRVLTESYEAARYGTGQASSTVAESALSAARAVVETQAPDESTVADD